MNTAHICVVQPGNTLAALPYLDHALYLQRMLGRLGMVASIGKNRLRSDCINLVLASHLGMDAEALSSHPCIVVNLERLKAGAAGPQAAYLEFLKSPAVIETDARQAEHYAEGGRSVPVLKLLGGLPPNTLRLEERSIGLLYHGPLNARTLPLLTQIERQGVTISRLDDTIHGPERQLLVGNARAVLQLLDGDDAGFDLRSAAPTWWAGTPLIAERPAAPIDPIYRRATHWFSAADIGNFFGNFLTTPGFDEQSKQMLAAWSAEDARSAFEPLLALAEKVLRDHVAPPARTRLNASMAATGYHPGWLNLAPRTEDAPDVTANVAAAPLPPSLQSRQGSFEVVRGPRADMIDEHAGTLFDNALQLLKVGGLFTLELPLPPSTGKDLQSLQAWVEEALADATHRFWRRGWLVHRFERQHAGWLDAQGMPLQAAALPSTAVARVVLRKVETSYRERALARAWRQDFGLPADAPLTA